MSDFDTSDAAKPDEDDDQFLDFESVKKIGDEILTFLEAPGNKDRVHRLIAAVKDYYSIFQAAGAGMNENTRRSAAQNVVWSAQSMKALIDAGVTDLNLAWDICSWAWPSGVNIPPELVSQALPLLQQRLASYLRGSSEPPVPPDFGIPMPASSLDGLIIRPAGAVPGDDATGYWGAIGPDGPRFFREVGPDGKPIWPDGKPV